MMTTQKQVRAAFWQQAGLFVQSQYRSGYKQNDYPTDTRVAFVDFVDSLQKSGQISEALAARVTL